jgi:hypothetical protein
LGDGEDFIFVPILGVFGSELLRIKGLDVGIGIPVGTHGDSGREEEVAKS